MKRWVFVGLGLIVAAASCATARDDNNGDDDDSSGGSGATGAAAGNGGDGNSGNTGNNGGMAGSGNTGNDGGMGGGAGEGGSGGGMGGMGGMAGAGGGGGGTDGATCADAADVTAAAFPFSLLGSFTDSPATGPSCDIATPTNTVWFTYTPASTGFYSVQLVNQDASAYSRLAIYDSAACPPAGADEVHCSTADAEQIATTVELTMGTTYLIMFYTDGSIYPMTDPSIDISPVVIGPGDSCTTAFDVSAAAFPHTEVGTFDVEPSVVGSCVSDTLPANNVWFSYTPTASGNFNINLSNASLHRPLLARGRL
jgi:hypothetical protein